MKYRCFATSVMGLEAIVADEIRELGLEEIITENGKVFFTTDEAGILKANLWLRSAERVFIEVGTFVATSFENLFNGVASLPWELYLNENSNFPVEAKSVKSTLFSLSDIQSISKRAIVKKLSKIYRLEWFEEKGARQRILVSILKDKVTVSIDTSGAGLHKRGYRAIGNDAPIKETLAAGIILATKWKPFIHLADPMCGSGTFLIEAALIKKNIAPGLYREFDCEKWDRFINSNISESLRAEAKSSIKQPPYEGSIEGYDIDPKSINQARANAKLAKVDDLIHFQVRDVKDFSTSKKYGYIITNPPYGERLSNTSEVEKLYKVLSKVFQKYPDWSKYYFTAFEDFEKVYGVVATKNRKLYNARLKAYLYQYFGEKPAKNKTTSSSGMLK